MKKRVIALLLSAVLVSSMGPGSSVLGDSQIALPPVSEEIQSGDTAAEGESPDSSAESAALSDTESDGISESTDNTGVSGTADSTDGTLGGSSADIAADSSATPAESSEETAEGSTDADLSSDAEAAESTDTEVTDSTDPETTESSDTEAAESSDINAGDSSDVNAGESSEGQTEEEGLFTQDGFIFRKGVDDSVPYVTVAGVEEANEAAELVIPESVTVDEAVYTVTGIEKDALSGSKAETLTIPSSIKSFGSQKMPALISVTAEDNEYFYAVDGVLFEKLLDESWIALYPAAREGTFYLIPDKTAGVAEGAFTSPANLETIVISGGVKAIKKDAFISGEKAIAIAVEEGEKLPEMEEGAFRFDTAEGNVLYFATQALYDALSQVAFADGVLLRDENGQLLTDTEKILKIVSDGIPEEILALIAKARPVVEVTDPSLTVGEVPGEDAALTEGFYRLVTSLSENYFLHVSKGHINEGANVVIAGSTMPGGVFYIKPMGDGTYVFKCAATEKYVTLAGPAAKTVNVQQGNDEESAARWFIVKNEDTSDLTIVSAENKDFVLDVSGGKLSQGQNVQLWTSNKSAAQRWSAVPAEDPAAAALADGTYYIMSAKNGGKVISVAGGSAANGANIILNSGNSQRSQMFEVKSLGYGNLYTIINRKSGRTLDAYNNGTERGTNIWQYDVNGSSAQIWRIEPAATEGTYTITGLSSGLVVDAKGGSTADGTNIQLWTSNGTPAQAWRFSLIEKEVKGTDAGIAEGYYRIRTELHSDRFLQAASMSENGNVVIKGSNIPAGEEFYVKPNGDGTYMIQSFLSKQYLSIEVSSPEVGANVVQKKKDSISAIYQKWYIREVEEGSGRYAIVSAFDNMYVLDVAGGKSGAGTNVRLWLSNNSKAERWEFMPIEDPAKNALANGAYTLAVDANTNYVLSVKGDSTGNTANVQIKKISGAWSEAFKVEKVSGYGNIYKITNNNSGLSLDAADNGKVNGTNIWQYSNNNSEAQFWAIMPKENESGKLCYTVMGVSSQLAMDVAGGKIEEGRNVQLWNPNGTKAQLWHFNTYTPTFPRNTNVTIYSRADRSKVIEVEGGSATNTANVRLASISNLTDQLFVITAVKGDNMRIRNVGGGKNLDVSNASTADGANVWSYEWNGSAAQQWKFIYTGDGDNSYYIQNVGSGKYLTNSGGNIVQSSLTKSNNQKFIVGKPISLKAGWQNISGKKRYFNSDGTYVTNAVTPDGKYYVGGDGAPIEGGWQKYGSYYYYYTANGFVNDARPYISILYPQTRSSKTRGIPVPNCDYYLTIDTGSLCQVTIYTHYPGTSGWNVPVFCFLCSPGTLETPTDHGSRRTGYTWRWKELMGPSWGQYASEAYIWSIPAGGGRNLGWQNNGEYFHSVACDDRNDHNLAPSIYNLLGTKQSHGCIRCSVRNAYWIYEFVPYMSPIYCNSEISGSMISHIPQPYAWDCVDPMDPAYTGNYGYTDNGVYYHYSGFH